MENIGFKEWANVCEALGTGVMSLILRKGGIHEGRGGFEFKHKAFFLFPTWFHTQGEKLTWQAPHPERFVFPSEDGRTSVDIDYLARLENVWRVTEWDKVAALAPLHVWNEAMVRERFVYDDESCLNVALVRVFKLPARWSFPYSKSYGEPAGAPGRCAGISGTGRQRCGVYGHQGRRAADPWLRRLTPTSGSDARVTSTAAQHARR